MGQKGERDRAGASLPKKEKANWKAVRRVQQAGPAEPLGRTRPRLRGRCFLRPPSDCVQIVLEDSCFILL